MGLERKRGDRKSTGKVLKIGVLGVEGRTLRYLVREEMHREMMRTRAGRRAWDFEERLNMNN